ncbi:MAG: hypothetical protein K5663_03885 [Clostridiales bacterium]|nr:hypothetical protein [Clostridiales bacterium]
MRDMKAVYENVATWMENPFWREYYVTAPTEECRKLIALEFWYSDFEEDNIVQEMKKTEEELILEDWKHLNRYCGNNPRKKLIQDRIEELSHK